MDRSAEHVITRPFESDDDYRRVRALLVECYSITPLDFNWDVRRWDGWRFYRNAPAWDPRWRDQVHLWETSGGDLVGAVMPEGSGDAHLQVHPGWRDLEGTILDWSEKHLADTISCDAKELRTFVFDDDAVRRHLLETRGWERMSSGGVVRRLRLGDEPRQRVNLPDGYKIRTTCSGTADSQRIADLLNAAFGRDSHTAGEHRTLADNALSFRRETDLVAEAEDGSLAAYVGACFDDFNSRGILEPVCTHPDHGRRGLARALTGEALGRLRQLGAAEVTVGTGDAQAANHFYDSLGFTESRRGKTWCMRR